MKGYHQEKIWDPVTRIWHWALVLSVSIGWGFGRFMDFDTIQWHFYLGYTTGVLLLVRCCWGLIGPEPVRFRSLLPTPTSTVNYLRHLFTPKPSGTAGHNPLGSLSVIAMLLLLAAQVSSGLFIESVDCFESGPMAAYASESFIRSMTWVHHLVADFILFIVGIHVAAILFYLFWKKENLIKPMISGWKWVKDSKPN